MVANVHRPPVSAIHPLHAILLAGALPLFLGAFLSDLAYSSTYQVQWTNFASWFIVGGLVFAGFALLWALIDLFRASSRGGRQIVYFLLLLVGWVLGLINAFVHAMDVWAKMPMALILSAIVTLLIIAAIGLGFSNLRVGART